MTNSLSSEIGAWWRIADHTTGNETGRMMIVNGFNPGAVFFRATVNVQPNTNYLFTSWILNLFKVTGFRIADDITVLRDGAVVSTDRAQDLDLDTVIARMVGRKLDNVYPKEQVEIGEKALEVEHFTQKDLFEDINFYVRKGEIVGFAGLVGAGRTETMRAVFGLDPHDSGIVKIDGKEVKIKSPSDSISHKLVMLSESRRDDGIVPVRSVAENASLASLKRFIYGGYTHRAKEREDVKQSFAKMNVKTPTLDTAISTLSGGNQQKVLLSRWMLCEPDVMILDEPTRGIDVGAKFEIYKLITVPG